MTVALSGDGGDELFAGYERFAAGWRLAATRPLPAPVQRAAARAMGRLPAGALRGRAGALQRFARGRARPARTPTARGSASFRTRSGDALLDGRRDDWALDDYRAHVGSARRAPRPLDRLLDLNLRTYLLDDLLVKVDRMSMAHGARGPLAVSRRELVLALHAAAAAAQGPRLALQAGAAGRGRRTSCRRRSCAAPKRGFGVPLDRWFREDLRGYVGSTLGSPRRQGAGATSSRRAVDRLLAEHDSGARNHGHALWTLLTLEVFLRRQNW